VQGVERRAQEALIGGIGRWAGRGRAGMGGCHRQAPRTSGRSGHVAARAPSVPEPERFPVGASPWKRGCPSVTPSVSLPALSGRVAAFQSVARRERSHEPESFRGGCSFGAGSGADPIAGLSRAAVPTGGHRPPSGYPGRDDPDGLIIVRKASRVNGLCLAGGGRARSWPSRRHRRPRRSRGEPGCALGRTAVFALASAGPICYPDGLAPWRAALPDVPRDPDADHLRL
jgi:hypothetical protein